MRVGDCGTTKIALRALTMNRGIVNEDNDLLPELGLK